MAPLEYALTPIVIISIACSVLLTPVVRKLAVRKNVIDQPKGGRKIHVQPTALWGGLATGITILVVLALLLLYAQGTELRAGQVIGFMIGIAILIAGGMLDDAYDLPPRLQILAPILASIAIVVSGSGIVQVTNPFGPGAFSLVWTQWNIGQILTISFPADLITILWLLVVTYAMKFLDGLDGLVAGMTAIGGALIAALAGSQAYFQPLVAVMALAIAGAHLGFLPYNRQGSMFLGEAGSTIAGFSLGVLAVISGAKLATAAAALGVPLVDIGLVVIGRLVRGVSPFRGDATHLHFRLLQAGMSQRNAVRALWGIALVFGLLALTLQTQGKIFLLFGLVFLTLTISFIAYLRANRKV